MISTKSRVPSRGSPFSIVRCERSAERGIHAVSKLNPELRSVKRIASAFRACTVPRNTKCPRAFVSRSSFERSVIRFIRGSMLPFVPMVKIFFLGLDVEAAFLLSELYEALQLFESVPLEQLAHFAKLADRHAPHDFGELAQIVGIVVPE